MRVARGLFVLAVLLLGGGMAFELTEMREPVRAVVRDYLLVRRVDRYQDELRAAAAESGVDPYLLAGIMAAESSGRVSARSKKGALGLFQLSPVTAEWRAQKLGLQKPTEQELLSDPLLNARLGADTMAWLLETYDGDIERALVAYNLGTGRLAEAVREAGGWEAWLEERRAAGDSQLLAYAARVRRYEKDFRERGLLEEPVQEPEAPDEP